MKMKKISITILGAITLALTIVGTKTLIMPLSEAGWFYYVFASFIGLGYISSILAIIQKPISKKFLLFYFYLQSVFIYTESFRIKLYAGFNLTFWSSNKYYTEAFNDPVRIEYNLVGLGLVLATFAVFKYSNPPTEKANEKKT